jgi:hypothetical protein
MDQRRFHGFAVASTEFEGLQKEQRAYDWVEQDALCFGLEEPYVVEAAFACPLRETKRRRWQADTITVDAKEGTGRI